MLRTLNTKVQYMKRKRYEKPTQSQESNTIPKPSPSFYSTGPVVRLAYTTTPNQVTQRTTSIPRSSAPVYLKVHMPSRLTSQNAPEAECIPRFPALLSAPSAATDLSTKPCWTIVLFTVKRKRGDLEDSVGWVAAMRALRTTFYRELMSCLSGTMIRGAYDNLRVPISDLFMLVVCGVFQCLFAGLSVC